MASQNIHDKTGVSEREAKAFKQALLAHAKLPSNRVCADCPKTGPTWCSVNLGVFICMDCAGGHRHLGVHLSKVRSLTLDTMTAVQFQFLKAMDNVRANSYWEAKMPSDYVKSEGNRTTTLNNKYKFKKWIDPDVPEPSLDAYPSHPWFQNGQSAQTQIPASTGTQPTQASMPKLPAPASAPKPKAPVQAVVQRSSTPAFDLLGGFEESPAPTASPPLVTQTTITPTHVQPQSMDLLSSHDTATAPPQALADALDDFASLAVASEPAQQVVSHPQSTGFDPFAASHLFLDPQPSVATSSSTAPDMPSTSQAAYQTTPPVTASVNSNASWQMPMGVPPTHHRAAHQPSMPQTTSASSRPATLKKSAAEIAAQVQSMYQQKPQGAYGSSPMTYGQQGAHPHHARSASAGTTGLGGTGQYPGQYQGLPPSPTQDMHGLGSYCSRGTMGHAWSNPGFQQPSSHTSTPGSTGSGFAAATQFSGTVLPPAGVAPPYGTMNYAQMPTPRQPWP